MSTPERPTDAPGDAATPGQTLPGLSPDVSANPLQSGQPASQPDFLIHSPHSFINIRGVLSRQDRQRGREQRAALAEEQFRSDITRISRLRDIASGVSSTKLDKDVPSELVMNAPLPEDLLSSYLSGNDDQRRSSKEGIRLFTEKGIKGTILALTRDISVLYSDIGMSKKEADAKARGFTTVTVNGKQKGLEHLGKDQQMSQLETVYEERDRLLRGNFSDYLYHLRSLGGETRIDAEVIHQMELEFDQAIEDENLDLATNVAARARREALRELSLLFEANIYTLSRIEAEEGKDPRRVSKEMEGLRLVFERDSLPDKGKLIERIMIRKARLSLKYLNGLIRLRHVLERQGVDETLGTEVMGSHVLTVVGEGEPIDERTAMVLTEAGRIDELLAEEMKRRGITFQASEDLARREVKIVSASHEDPTLMSVYERVILLRKYY